MEHYINKKFNGAILKSAVGYTGGEAQNPKCAPVGAFQTAFGNR